MTKNNADEIIEQEKIKLMFHAMNKLVLDLQDRVQTLELKVKGLERRETNI